jgi:hypothetical protein
MEALNEIFLNLKLTLLEDESWVCSNCYVSVPISSDKSLNSIVRLAI